VSTPGAPGRDPSRPVGPEAADAPARHGFAPHWFEGLADTMGAAYLRYSFTRGTDQEVAFIDEAVGGLADAVVLDVGCGPGRHARAMAARGARVVGLDIARRFCEVGRDLGGGVVGWVRADARSLPVAPASVDVAVSLCQGAFGVPPVGAGDDADAVILAEVARVLRPGGVLVLSAFSAYFQVRWLEDHDRFDADLGRNHEQTTVHDESGRPHPAELWTACYTPRELRLLASAVGLEVAGVWSVTPGDYARRPPDLDHPELLVVARRP